MSYCSVMQSDFLYSFVVCHLKHPTPQLLVTQLKLFHMLSLQLTLILFFQTVEEVRNGIINQKDQNVRLKKIRQST